MARDLIQVHRGTLSNIPTLTQGEFGFTTDENQLYIGGISGNVKLTHNIKNVKSFGAKGDGINDDTGEIQQAIDSGNIIFFPKGTYKITSELIIPSNIKIIGEVDGSSILDFSSMPAGVALNDRRGFNIVGSIDSAINVVDTLILGDNQFTVADASSLSVDDLILISNDELYDPAVTNPNDTKREMLKIKIISGNTITVYENTIFPYALSNTKIQKINVKENIDISNLTFQMGGIGSAHNAIYCDYTSNIKIENIKIDGAESVGVSFLHTYYGNVNKCQIQKCTSPTPIGNTGYGVLADDSCKFINIIQNRFEQCRHSVSGGHLANNVTVRGNQSTSSIDQAYDCHEPCFYWLFDGNFSHGDTGGFNIRGSYVTVSNNIIINPLSVGIHVLPFSDVTQITDINILGNKIINCPTTVIQLDGTLGTIKNCVISNNIIDGGKFNGILMEFCENIIVSNNNIQNISTTNSYGIYSLGTVSVNNKNIYITNNYIDTIGKYGVFIKFTENIEINNCIVKNCGTSGMNLEESDIIQIVGGEAENNVFVSLLFTNCNDIILNNFIANTTSDVSGKGFRIIGSSDISIIGNLIKNNTSNAMYITTSNNIIVTNNNVRNNTDATKINIDGSATNIINTNNLLV